jgi:hypothetical protein
MNAASLNLITPRARCAAEGMMPGKFPAGLMRFQQAIYFNNNY